MLGRCSAIGTMASPSLAFFSFLPFSGECLGGALYWKDLAILAQKIGFSPPRLVSANIITIQNKELENVVGK